MRLEHFKKTLLGLIASLFLSLVLAACSSSPTAPATSDSTPSATTAAITTAGSGLPGVPTGQTQATGTPITASTPTIAATMPPVPTPTAVSGLNNKDQVLNIAAADIATFDPALITEVNSSFVSRQIYSGLLTLDKDLKVVPDLAERMPEVSENGTVYTFYLRKGVKFHSGREVTAEDVKYSWERATDPKLAAPDPASTLPASNYMSEIVGVKERLEGKAANISGVTVVDKTTLRVKLDGAKPYFLAKMTYDCFAVLNKEAVDKGFNPPDGTGAFKVAEYKKGQLIRLERNPNFYNGTVYLNQVNLLQGANAQNATLQYEQGKVDYAFIGSGVDVERFLDKNNPYNKELVIKPQLDIQYVAFNTRVKPFDDPKVRQAFYMVIDRARIARVMFEGKVLKADTILPPDMPGYSGNPGSLSYDINRARSLIEQSSYRGVDKLPKIVLYTTGDGLAKVLQETYKQAFGVEIEVRVYDFKNFRSGLSQGQFQMYTYGWVADYPDPENFLRSLLGSASPYNETGYKNERFDEMMQQADALTDPQARLKLYAAAEQIVLEDAPLLPVYHSISYLLVKPYVKGLTLTASGIWSLKEVYIQK
jgi:oligopeptide transport system substrate-binding protein